MCELSKAANLVYSLRHSKEIDDFDLMDIYDILKSCMEIIKEKAKRQDVVYILENENK